jgi:hypothetical protein
MFVCEINFAVQLGSKQSALFVIKDGDFHKALSSSAWIPDRFFFNAMAGALHLN